MKEKDRLTQLFDHARSEKPIVDTDRIEKLVASGKKVSAQKIKLGQARRGFIKPLNLIIMFATIVSLVAIISVFSGGSEESLVPSHQSLDLDSSFVLRPSSFGGEEDSLGKLSVISYQSSDGDESLVISHQSLVRDKEEIAAPVYKDTVFEGRILELTKEELGRLGFEFDDNGFYYLNEMVDGSKINFWNGQGLPSGQGQSYGFGHGRYVNQALTKQPTKRNYYPVCTSSLRGDRLVTIWGLPDDFKENFELYNDTLVPVLFRSSDYNSDFTGKDVLAWFRVSEQFFKDLGKDNPDISLKKYQEIRKVVLQYPLTNRVTYNYSNDEKVFGNLIHLDRSFMSCLGFTDYGDSLVYGYYKDGIAIESFRYQLGGGARQIIDPKIKKKLASKPLVAPLFSFYDTEMQTTIKTNHQLYASVDSTINVENWIEICVPIQFDLDEGHNCFGNTFLFYPTEQLFACLPDSIADPMRKEYNVNVKPRIGFTITSFTRTGVKKVQKDLKVEESVPCQYFKSFCEGLPGLDNLNVYPNPTSGELNLEILLSEGKTIDYRIFDLSGRLMVDDVERKKYDDAGRYNLKMDLGHLDNGFYLLVLTDEGGARMTRRVVKN